MHYIEHKKWSSEEDDVLRKMVHLGHRVIEIAAALNRSSKNSVIGRAARIGLRISRAPKQERKEVLPKVKKVNPPAPVVSPSKPIIRVVFDESIAKEKRTVKGGVAPLDIKDGQCRWIVGEVPSGRWYFCGKKTEVGSWCACHRRIVFQPARVVVVSSFSFSS